jgi:urease accessory protein UreE
LKEFDGSVLLQTEEDIKLAIKIELEDYNEESFKLLLKDIEKARARMKSKSGSSILKKLLKADRLTYTDILTLSDNVGLKIAFS